MALTDGLPIDRDSVERLVDLAESVYAGGQDTFEAGVAKSMTAILAYYTFLNEQLWGHYQIDGINAVEGDEMRLVKLPSESMRGGLLTQGTVLAVTSNPDRTSPVKRGLFILENLLGTPPAAPPPNIPALEDVEPDA